MNRKTKRNSSPAAPMSLSSSITAAAASTTDNNLGKWSKQALQPLISPPNKKRRGIILMSGSSGGDTQKSLNRRAMYIPDTLRMSLPATETAKPAVKAPSLPLPTPPSSPPLLSIKKTYTADGPKDAWHTWKLYCNTYEKLMPGKDSLPLLETLQLRRMLVNLYKQQQQQHKAIPMTVTADEEDDVPLGTLFEKKRSHAKAIRQPLLFMYYSIDATC